MPLEYRSTGQEPETWRALEKKAKARSIKVDALLRELVGATIAAGFTAPTVQASSSGGLPAVIPPGSYFIKGGLLCQHFATFDSDVGTIDEIIKAFKDGKFIDQDKIHDALRWGDFSHLSEAEKRSAKLDQDLLLGNAKIAEAVNKAKAARSPPSRSASRGPYPDAERYRRCGGCGKYFGNMSSSERTAHGGQDCRAPSSSTVLVEGVPVEKSRLPAHFFDDKGELKAQYKSLESSPAALPHPEVGGEGA